VRGASPRERAPIHRPEAFLAPSDSRLWRILALLRRGMPAERIRGVTGISAWFLWEFERAIALEHEVRRYGARMADPRDEEAAILCRR